jgi:hypothetical protein
VSAAAQRFSQPEIDALLEQSRARNLSLGVTGLLLYCDGSFMQYFEGPAPGVEQIWSSIRRDPRHSSVTMLFDEPVSERLFTDWSMGFKPTPPPSLVELVRRTDRQRKAMYVEAFSPQIVGLLLQNFLRLNWH